MIRKFRIQNFKAIRSAEINLERFTVFVGPNASGKTSILQALKRLSNTTGGRYAREPEHELAASFTRASTEDLIIEAAGEWEGRSGNFRVMLAQNETPDAYRVVGSWELVTSTALLRLDPSRLAEPSVAEGVEPRIEVDGTGLASVLAQMALNRPDEFGELTKAVREVIPQVSRIRLSLTTIERAETEVIEIDGQPLSRAVTRARMGHRLVLDMIGASDVSGEDVSEGTMLTLGLLTVVMSPSRPRLLLLDDLDRGLHPKAQRDLVSQLRLLLARFPDLQVVATSHSPYLVDCMKPEEVRLTTVRPDGSAHCAPLKDHPRFEEWKDVMRPGEFWSTVGEDWVKSPEAAPQGNA